MPAADWIRRILEDDETVDQLAAIEHERWAHWQRYVHDHCERLDDGSLVIPATLAARWAAQIEMTYAELTEQEKDSDREQVRRYIPVVISALFTG
jgi:hypothetical protein